MSRTAAARHVAFLRAVNVGGRTVKMATVKTLFEDLGLTGVSTFIASGNVIFAGSRRTAAALERDIEAALAGAFGFAVATIIRSGDEVAAVAAQEPFPPAVRQQADVYVGFLKAAPAAAAARKALALQTDADLLRIDGREIYWLARQGMARPTITMAALERALGVAVTFRNMNTVQRLVEKFALD